MICVNRLWLPPEENHEVTRFVREDGGEGHYRIVGQGRGGAQLAHNKDMLPCVRQEHFTSTQVSVVWLCAKFPKRYASQPVLLLSTYRRVCIQAPALVSPEYCHCVDNTQLAGPTVNHLPWLLIPGVYNECTCMCPFPHFIGLLLIHYSCSC